MPSKTKTKNAAIGDQQWTSYVPQCGQMTRSQLPQRGWARCRMQRRFVHLEKSGSAKWAELSGMRFAPFCAEEQAFDGERVRRAACIYSFS